MENSLLMWQCLRSCGIREPLSWTEIEMTLVKSVKDLDLINFLTKIMFSLISTIDQTMAGLSQFDLFKESLVQEPAQLIKLEVLIICGSSRNYISIAFSIT